MLQVPLQHARSGMTLAMEVIDPLRGQRLLSRGFTLTEAIIRKLHELHVHEVWIEYPNTEEIASFVAPQVVGQHGRLVGVVSRLIGALNRDAHAEIDWVPYRQSLQSLVEPLVAHPMSASYIAELGGASTNALRHAAEVCYMSVLLGLKLRDYLVEQRPRLQPTDARCLISLGFGALLHDIGMTLVKQEVRERYERTRNENDAAWRRHAIVGHHAVSGCVPAAAAGVVRHHHQHFDGSGFPTQPDESGELRGLAGEEIHIFARIVCVANHFDRLRRRGDGTLRPRVRVLREMLTGPLAPRFDPVVLAALTKVVPAYPPGAVVTLNSGRPALVVRWHPDAPCQPTIRRLRLVETEGNVVLAPHGERVDLRDEPDLLIAEHEGCSVLADNFRMRGPVRSRARAKPARARSHVSSAGTQVPAPPAA
jgi:HD-GYP domain-containing protein (c-di-GMP phosphodiesterase class II)